MMARTKWIFGGQPSAPPQDTKPPPEPVSLSAEAKKFGLENFGNTCYANSVLQALYFCAPFRDLVIQASDPSIPPDTPPSAQDASVKVPPPVPLVPVRRKAERKLSSAGSPSEATTVTLPPPRPIPSSPPTLFSALRSLFLHISTHPGDKGTVAPRAFIDKLKESKEDFRSTMHQDAHEFLNHLLNMIVEEIEEEKKSAQSNAQGEDLTNSVATLASKPPPTIITATTYSNSGTSSQDATLVHKLFEGVLTSETRCLTCETVSSREESFLDLSIDIEQNSSVTACLRSFSASEMLCQRNKFFCDACCDLQEAEKRMKIKQLPNVLALHLKRFKFQEDVQKYIKLTYRVVFPFELRLFNTVDDLDNADRLYNLFAIVVHIGNGPHHGHYISIVKSAGSWLVFDDDNVYPIPEGDIPKYYGDSNSGSAYVLYYQAADIDLAALGLHLPQPDTPLLSEPTSQSISTQPRTPSQHSQLTPSLPPGLLAETELIDASEDSHPAISSSTISPISPAQANDKFINVPRQTFNEYSSSLQDEPLGLPPGAAPAVSPAASGSGALSPAHRSASVSARPSTASAVINNKFDPARSPLHSASSPSLVVPENSSPVPPVPPLPSPTLVLSPAPATQTNGKTKAKEGDKDKDKSRKESKGWFKRRSFRLGDKASKHEKSDTEFLSSSPKDERPASSGWFKGSSQPRRRPSLTGSSENARKAENRLSARLDPPQTIAAASSNASSAVTHRDDSSSLGPSIVLSSPPTTISSPPPLPPKSSPSSSKSPPLNEKLDTPPPRKSSLVPSSSPRSGSMDQQRRQPTKSSNPPKVARPATVSGMSSNGVRQLPPVPSPQKPFQSKVGRTPPSDINGQGLLVSEPESVYPLNVNRHGNENAPSVNTSQSELHSTSASTSSLHARPAPPKSIAASVGHNNSTSSAVTGGSAGGTSGTNAPFKRATRKLSLTAPILGLGRRDKDKGVDGQGRREKVSSSSLMHRLDPRI